MTDGLQRLAPRFTPLYEALIERSRLAAHWHPDETRWQVYETNSEKASYRWCLWVFQSREVVVYTLDPTPAARVPKEHFAGVPVGIVSADRHSSYNSLAKEGALQIAYCRVGGDVAIPTPLSPGRAELPHPVPHGRGSLAAA